MEARDLLGVLLLVVPVLLFAAWRFATRDR
jgi:hypothetical protein